MLPKILPICRNVCCSKNSLSDRIFWKKEIDHQYQFYLATLRAQRDARYLLKEHSDLLLRIKHAEDANVELRKEIRLLETELFLMCQRNAHDSVVIDGLHDADYIASESNHLESEMRRRLDMATVEGDHEDTLSKSLKEQIELLKRKDVEDAELIVSVQPLEDKLKTTLEEEKLKNHQQAARFKRNLEEMLIEFRNRNSEFEKIIEEKSSAIMWSDEIFRSIFIKEARQQSAADTDTTSVKSSNETDRFDVSSQEKASSIDDLGEAFQEMKDTYCEFVAKKELLDLKNAVNINIIYDCLLQFSESIHTLTNEYLSIFEISTEVEFIKEYLGRLDAMRKKKDVVSLKSPDDQTVQRIEQLNIIYSILICEKTFLDNSLHYFASTLKDDFEAHCVILCKSEELFEKSSLDS